MKNFILGLIFGVALTLVLYKPINDSSIVQVQACIEQHMTFIDPKDPELLQAVKEQGFKNLRALVKDRCTTWVSNGQTFR